MTMSSATELAHTATAVSLRYLNILTTVSDG
jgi:hypothetical protein